MTRKQWQELLVAALLVVLAIGVLRRPRSRVQAEAATTTVPGKGTPSAAPFGLFGFYLNTGFSLQPEDRYTYVNNAKLLTTDTAHSMWAIFNLTAKDHFQWYQSVDGGKNWTKAQDGNKASDKYGTTPDLIVTPSQEGTVYYQATFQYYTVLPIWPVTSTYFSRVAAVTTLPAPIDASGIKVSIDDDYLYNNQDAAASTFVHGQPTPANATGNITWTSSDPTIAAVDAKTGKVTANKSGKDGQVTITGTVQNDGLVDVSDSVTLTVGGGLADQTVTEGQSADFRVLGNIDQKPDNVAWHRVDANGQNKVVANTQSLNYQTPATTLQDDGALYYAEVTVTMLDEQEKPQTQTIKTRQAKLTVNPDTAPRVTITSEMKNSTASSEAATTAQQLSGTVNPIRNDDTAHNLTNIVQGDECQITGTITDANWLNSTMASGELTFELPSSLSNQVKFILNNVPQAVAKQTVGSETIFSVSGLDFSQVIFGSYDYEIDFTSPITTNQLYTTGVRLRGSDKNNQLLGTYSGPSLRLNFTDGVIDATAHPITFGTLDKTSLGQTVAGQVVDGGNLLDVRDNRRRRDQVAVQLQQSTPFYSGDRPLAADLFYDSGSLSYPLSNVAQTVINAGAGIAVQSIGAKGEHLNLKLLYAAYQAGHYTSTLNWTFAAVPSV
ncbi:Ig-like domain-containing protein [Levilactobacillus mulengensis]|uniref:Ig-like domain-containing protein n=1 Tax=Levilactobacillus mulengensis TaxID=2486025 RepID=UPI000F78BD56|nr:Ig-like domain-containing protein [Levilactobacillus mulengensis]